MIFTKIRGGKTICCMKDKEDRTSNTLIGGVWSNEEMTGSRRLQRHGGVKLETQTLEEATSPIMNMQAPLPQHSVIPDIPTLNEVVFQFGYLANSLVLMALQYLNLYNTINWIPHRRHEYAMDFYAIDTDLVVLIVLVLSYRLLKASLSGTFDRRDKPHSLLIRVARALIMFVYYLPILGTFTVLTSKYPPGRWIFLLLPAIIYLLLFGSHLPRYIVEDCLKFRWPFKKSMHPYDSLVPPPTERSSRNIFHACSMNPEHVRREVYILKTDFNYRLKTVYYEAMISVYYGAIIPFLFCKNIHHLDLSWICCYIFVSALTMALIGCVQRVPANYMDTLHKSAVHLGKWRKHEERLVNIPHSTWSELTVWPKGVNVRHVKGLFKAEGINNAAEPGNSKHAKFYVMFKKPEYVCVFIAFLCASCTLVQFIMLVKFTHWHQVLATCGLMLSNYYALFISTRDLLVLYQVYKDERYRYD